jgi:tetratricopeptide (TPR) repeat protein
MASNAFQNEYVLKKVVDAYKPSFISVPSGIGAFRETVKKFGQYKPVFFDDAEVLYMDTERHSHVAEEFELKAIDPFEIAGKTVDVIVGKKERGPVKTELSRMLRIFPEGLTANQIMGEICLEEKDYQKALGHAHAIISAYPESPVGYKLKGKALVGLKRLDEAERSYVLALKRSGGKDSSDLHKRLATIYIEQGKFGKAYDAARKGVDIFAPDTNYVQLFQRGSAALLTGRDREAEIILKLGYEKIPDDNQEWKENYHKLFLEISRRAHKQG